MTAQPVVTRTHYTPYRLPLTPLVRFDEVPVAAGNELVERWQHDLGPCNRPFGMQAFVLHIDNEPVSVAVSASTVGSTAAGFSRYEVVELARLCTAPGFSVFTRVALRLWREVAARAWPHWQVVAAVAYSQNTRHPGNIYRADGWKLVKEDAGSSGGGTYSTKRDADHPASGSKRLWLWEYRP